jgi:hypothetical protein
VKLLDQALCWRGVLMMMVMVMMMMGGNDERAGPGHYEHFGVVAASLGAELDWEGALPRLRLTIQ